MFKFSEEFNYLMPAHFGGYAGQPQPATYHDVTSIIVTYRIGPGNAGGIPAGADQDGAASPDRSVHNVPAGGMDGRGRLQPDYRRRSRSA